MGDGRWRWRAALILVAAGAAVALYGYRVHRDHWPPHDAVVALLQRVLSPLTGRSAPSGEGDRAPDRPLTALQREKMEQLEALGYLATSRRAPPGEGVTIHEQGSTFAGVNLYSSMHGPEALLIDMAGTVLHRWSCPYREAFPEHPAPRDTSSSGYFRGVQLFTDGDLLAIFEGMGMVRLDPSGALRWAVHNGAHHDVDVGPDGTIYVLTRRARIVEQVHPTEPILEDSVDVLTPEGRLLERISILDAVRSSADTGLLSGSPATGDIFHANSLRVLDGRLAPRFPQFAQGNFLISLRNRDAIVVVAPRSGRVVWTMRGLTLQQHDATLLDDGTLLVFDNRDETSGSRVIEVDAVTRRILWQYPRSAAPGLFSDRFGTAQRLENGNTLMTFSELGVALEVTPDQRIVWRFVSPHRTGVGNTFVVPLLDVQRYPRDYVASWLGVAD